MKERKYYNEDIIRQTIPGKELTLRPYNEETDKNILYRMFKSDRNIKWFYPYVMKSDFKHTWLEGKCTMFDSSGEFSFVIVRNSDKAIMGCISCDSGYCSSHHVLKLGYYMGEKYRKKGYMQKALKMLIDYGFKGKLYQMDDMCFKNRKYVVYAFKATADLDNAASDHVLRKLGFVCSGIELCEYSHDGQPCRDRKHYCLENPKHPPSREKACLTNKALIDCIVHQLTGLYDGKTTIRLSIGDKEFHWPMIDNKTGLPVLSKVDEEGWE